MRWQLPDKSVRSEWAIPIMLVLSVAALGAAFLVTQAGVLTKSEQTWRVGIAPFGPGSWSVEVPRLLTGPNATPEDEAALTALLQTLRAEGDGAHVQLQATILRVRGNGPVNVAAATTTARGDLSFLHWEESGRAVSRLDDDAGPPIRVTWSVAFTSGEDGACAAAGEQAIDLPPALARAFASALWEASC